MNGLHQCSDDCNVKNPVTRPGRWHNGSTFVFCADDCPVESEPTPTSAHACGEVTGFDDGHQEVSRCSNRGGSWRMYIHYIHVCKSE